MPLVLVLHGYGAAAQILDYFGMEALAEARGFLVSHPTGTTDAEGKPFWSAWQVGSGSSVDDSSYLRGVIEEIARACAVNRQRIYLTGHSAGGAMCYRMAGDHADLLAGIAPYAGCMELDPDLRRPSEPVNVLHIHGTADEVVPYAGRIGEATRGWPLASVRNWAAYNGCERPVSDPPPVLTWTWACLGSTPRCCVTPPALPVARSSSGRSMGECMGRFSRGNEALGVFESGG